MLPTVPGIASKWIYLVLAQSDKADASVYLRHASSLYVNHVVKSVKENFSL